MITSKPKNDNYAAVVVEIKTLVPLAGCDFVQAAIIMGNQVIVDKSTKVGDVGLYFPLETQLSESYLKANNLYRKPELNAESTKKGYFEENGRIRCVKFRGHKSEGLFMPFKSLYNLPIPYGEDNKIFAQPFDIGETFDELEGIEICRKYVIKKSHTPGLPGSGKGKKGLKKYESKLVENQFRFHDDTSMLYKNLHKLNPEDIISITYKLHGTSGISSYVLCKKHHTLADKFKAWLWDLTYAIPNLFRSTQYHFYLNDKKYDYLYASRKVIKNEILNPNANHFYDTNIWELAHEQVKEHLQKGMTFYYEIVGYLPNGAMIQKDYDYGYENTFGIYIYRITSTNVDGKVIEFSAKQVQDFCKKNGLNAVPELYYGYAKNFTGIMPITILDNNQILEEYEVWRNHFLSAIKANYNEKDCYMCKTKVPEEGVVIRIEGLDFEAYKQKSNRFYERETKLLDAGESDIESDN